MENVTVKEELSPDFEELEFEELEFEDYKPEEVQNRVIELFALQNVPADTDGTKEVQNRVIELFALQNVPADADGPKVPPCQNDQESSQIIIKEEIDCDVNDDSVSDLDFLPFADKDPGPALRRSARKRCPRFTIVDLFDSSGDETAVSERGNEVRIQSSRHIYDENPRLSARRGRRVLQGRSKTSDRRTVCGVLSEQFCDICGRRFSRIGYLKRHIATHHKSKAYSCNLCGKSFTRSDNLKDHERLHRGELFGCSVCGQEFSQAGHLVQHARTHTGERPFRCADCGKVFRVRGYLRDHVRIHTGERPFACRVCGKSFRQAAHLRGHVRLHTGERRHACDVCGRQFFRRAHLKVHACTRSARRRRRRKVQC